MRGTVVLWVREGGLDEWVRTTSHRPASCLIVLTSIRKVTHLINTGEWELCHMPSVIHFHCHQESSLALANQTLFPLARPHRVSCFCFCFRAVLSVSSSLAIENGFDTNLGEDSGYQ